MKIAGERIVPLVLEATGNLHIISFTIIKDAPMLKRPDITITFFSSGNIIVLDKMRAYRR